jgi:hypothetical protein
MGIGILIAVMIGTVALAFGPVEKPGAPGGEAGAPEIAQVESAAAWYYTQALCDGSFSVGDWMQHFYDSNSAHRTTKISGRYRAVGWIWVDIKKQRVHYRDGRVIDRDFVSTNAAACWPA